MNTLYIMCGFPYSGKSTLAKELSAQTGIPIVSFDDTWRVLEISFPDLTYDMCVENCRKQITNYLLKENRSVIYDSTNLSKHHRDELATLAESNNAKSEVIFIDISVEEIKKRRETSRKDKTHHDVADKDFYGAMKRIDRPEDAIGISNTSEKDSLIASVASAHK